MIVISRRRRRQPRRGLRRPGMAGVSALVIGARRDLGSAELIARGMAGMGASAKSGGFVDELTGGKLSEIQGKLARVELGLKLAIGSSLFAGAMTLLALRRK